MEDEAQKLRDQIKRIREQAGMSVRDMAAAIGMSPSGYSHYEQRLKEPVLPYRIAVAIADAVAAAGVPRARVMALAGADLVVTSDDGTEIPIELKAHRVGIPAKRGGDGHMMIPVYDVCASAGHGMIVDDYEGIAEQLSFPPDYLRRITTSSPKNLSIISVKGDSMEPTLSDDDIVMLDTSKTSLGYEGLFVIRIYDVLHVKRLSHSRPGYVMVISDNRDLYPPREYSMEDVQVVGKVLWAGGKV